MQGKKAENAEARRTHTYGLNEIQRIEARAAAKILIFRGALRCLLHGVGLLGPRQRLGSDLKLQLKGSVLYALGRSLDVLS